MGSGNLIIRGSSTGNTYDQTPRGIVCYNSGGKRIDYSVFCEAEGVAYRGNGKFTWANKAAKQKAAVVDSLLMQFGKALTQVGNPRIFLGKLYDIALKYHMDAKDLLVLLYSESRLDPNQDGGLFQLQPSIGKRLFGFDKAGMTRYKQMPAVQQLDYYDKCLARTMHDVYGDKLPKKVPRSVVYAMNFTPISVKNAIKDPKGILARKNDPNPYLRRAYNSNHGPGSLADGKDYISLDTLETRLKNKENELKKYHL